MGKHSSSAQSVTNTNVNTSNIQNIQNHQTDFETHVNNQDYLKEVGGDRVGGSVNTFNGIQNAGKQCFGATCLQELGLLGGGDGLLGGGGDGLLGGVLGEHGLVKEALWGHGGGLFGLQELCSGASCNQMHYL